MEVVRQMDHLIIKAPSANSHQLSLDPLLKSTRCFQTSEQNKTKFPSKQLAELNNGTPLISIFLISNFI